jgi:hypothetical protein
VLSLTLAQTSICLDAHLSLSSLRRQQLTTPTRGVFGRFGASLSRAAAVESARRGPCRGRATWTRPRTPVRTPDEGSGGPGDFGRPSGTTTTSTGSGPSPRGGYALPGDGRSLAPGDGRRRRRDAAGADATGNDAAARCGAAVP